MVVDSVVAIDAIAGLSVDHRLRPSLREVDDSNATMGKADARQRFGSVLEKFRLGRTGLSVFQDDRIT